MNHNGTQDTGPQHQGAGIDPEGTCLERFLDTKIDFTSALGTVKMGEMGAEECKRLLEEKYGEAKGVILEVMGDTGDNYSVTIQQGFESIQKEKNLSLKRNLSPVWIIQILDFEAGTNHH